MARRVASAKDIDESPRYAAGTLMSRNAPARTCIMTATQKYRTSPLPAAIPGGFARSPASSRVANRTLRASLSPWSPPPSTTPGTMTPTPAPSGWHGLPVFSAWVSEPDDAEPPPAASR